MTTPEIRSLSVSELNNFVKDLLNNVPILNNISVNGEISKLTIQHNTGNIYFKLKDSEAVVQCAFFKRSAQMSDIRLFEGQKVTVTGKISLYARDGTYMFYINKVSADGIGDMFLAFEQLKQKLFAEGLFEEEKKKPLPKYPKNIGIITAPTGAVISDMINIISRRFPQADIKLYPTQVQGAEAAKQMIHALRVIDKLKLDVIIIGRGGGSAEDLWAFNDEALARTVFDCQTPIVSAVGHEPDYTIIDFVADKRAPTPSAAAELVVPDRRVLHSQLDNVQKRLDSLLTTTYNQKSAMLSVYKKMPVLSSPLAYFNERNLALGQLAERLERTSAQRLSDRINALAMLDNRLKSLSPMAVLSRGYAAVFDSQNNVVNSAANVPDSAFSIRFSDGAVDVVKFDI